MKNSKILISFLLVLLVALISASAVSAADIDVNGTTDVAINHAIGNASAGDTINLGVNKVYTVDSSINVDKNVTIVGVNVTLNAEAQTKSKDASAPLYNGVIFVNKEGSGSTITGLKLVNTNANKNYTYANTLKGYGIQLSGGATGCVVDNCSFYDFNTGVYISAADSNIVQNSFFTGVATLINNIPSGPKDRGSYGVGIMGSKYNIIQNNLFYGPLCDGVSIASSSKGTQVLNNEFEGNAYSIFFGGGSTAGSVMAGNTFKDCGSFYGVRTSGDTAGVVDNFTNLPVISVQKASDNFEIYNNTFYANQNNVLIGANEKNTAHGYPSDIGNINVYDNTVIPANEKVVMSTVVLFNIVSESGILNPVGPIAIVNNTLNGAKSAAYWTYDWSKSQYGDVNIAAAAPATTFFEIVSLDADKAVVVLKDVNGKKLAGKTVSANISGNVSSLTTDEVGQVAVENYGQAILDFAGDKQLAASTITLTAPAAPAIVPTALIITEELNIKVGETGTIALVLTDGTNPIANQNVSILINNEYQGFVTTDENGTATIDYKATAEGTNYVTAYYYGDNQYASSIDFGVVKVTKKSTTMAAKALKTSYKRTATKYVQVTLKSNGRAVSGKKVTVTVNGKTFTGKTGSNGVAKVKVTLTKVGTFTFTAKFAGDSTYKAVSKTGKIKVTK